MISNVLFLFWFAKNIISNRLFMSPKNVLHQSRLLTAADDGESSTIMPLTRYEYEKEKFQDITETQKL